MNTLSRFSIIAIACICCHCNSSHSVAGPSAQEQGASANRIKTYYEYDMNSIRKAVLADSLKRIDQNYGHVIFVSIENHEDPSLQVMKQLQELNPKVRAFSRCLLKGNATDKVTGEEGLCIFLKNITPLTPIRAQAETWLFYSKRAGYGMTYELACCEGNEWHIMQCRKGPVA